MLAVAHVATVNTNDKAVKIYRNSPMNKDKNHALETSSSISSPISSLFSNQPRTTSPVPESKSSHNLLSPSLNSNAFGISKAIFALIRDLWNGDYDKFWNLWKCMTNRAAEARFFGYLLLLRIASGQFRGSLDLVQKILRTLSKVDLC